MNHPASAALRKPFPAELLAALRERCGERVTTSATVREHHGKDESAHDMAPPDAVVFPETSEEISAIVRLCKC